MKNRFNSASFKRWKDGVLSCLSLDTSGQAHTASLAQAQLMVLQQPLPQWSEAPRASAPAPSSLGGSFVSGLRLVTTSSSGGGGGGGESGGDGGGELLPFVHHCALAGSSPIASQNDHCASHASHATWQIREAAAAAATAVADGILQLPACDNGGGGSESPRKRHKRSGWPSPDASPRGSTDDNGSGVYNDEDDDEEDGEDGVSDDDNGAEEEDAVAQAGVGRRRRRAVAAVSLDAGQRFPLASGSRARADSALSTASVASASSAASTSSAASAASSSSALLMSSAAALLRARDDSGGSGGGSGHPTVASQLDSPPLPPCQASSPPPHPEPSPRSGPNSSSSSSTINSSGSSGSSGGSGGSGGSQQISPHYLPRLGPCAAAAADANPADPAALAATVAAVASAGLSPSWAVGGGSCSGSRSRGGARDGGLLGRDAWAVRAELRDVRRLLHGLGAREQRLCAELAGLEQSRGRDGDGNDGGGGGARGDGGVALAEFPTPTPAATAGAVRGAELAVDLAGVLVAAPARGAAVPRSRTARRAACAVAPVAPGARHQGRGSECEAVSPKAAVAVVEAAGPARVTRGVSKARGGGGTDPRGAAQPLGEETQRGSTGGAAATPAPPPTA